MSAIKYAAGMQLPKGEKQRRAQQSARDKRQHAQNASARTPVKPQNRPKSSAGGVPGTLKKNDQVFEVPRNFGTKSAGNFAVQRSNRFKDGIVAVGEDHLDFIVQPATGVSGTCLLNWDVSPAALGGSRLEKYGALYEKFLFEDLEFIWSPSIGTTTAGNIGFAYDSDVMDATPPASVDGLRQYSGYQYNCDANIWLPQSLKVKPTAPDAGYYTNPVVTGSTDDRLSYQGQFYAFLVAPSSAATGTNFGRVRLRYRCHFFTPQLDNTVSGSEFGASSGTSITAVNNADFLAWFNNVSALVSGAAQYLPKLDSNGKYYLDLATGVYKFYSGIKAAANTATSAGAGTVQVDTPTMTLYENPVTAAAPQPWIQQTESMPGYQVTGDVWSSAASEFVVGVPRGGAKLYQTYDVGTTITTPGGGSFDFDIERLGNFVPSYAGLFLARWEGAEECQNSQLPEIKTRALARSFQKKLFRPAHAVDASPFPGAEDRRRSAVIPSSTLAAQFPVQATIQAALPGY